MSPTSRRSQVQPVEKGWKEHCTPWCFSLCAPGSQSFHYFSVKPKQSLLTRRYFSESWSLRHESHRNYCSWQLLPTVNHPCVKNVCLSSHLNLSSLIQIFILFFQTRRPLICSVFSNWCTHFFRIKVEFGTPSSGCRSSSLACAGRGTASRAGLSLGSQRTGRFHWRRRHRQTPTTSAFTVVTRDPVFLMRKAKAKWGERTLKFMSAAQYKLHCFPASPLLVSRTLRFAVLLRGTPSNPRKDRSSTWGV